MKIESETIKKTVEVGVAKQKTWYAVLDSKTRYQQAKRMQKFLRLEAEFLKLRQALRDEYAAAASNG